MDPRRVRLPSPPWDRIPGPKSVCAQLRQAGHESFLAGGCVRDLLRGQDPSDWDVATSATPADVERVFRRTIPIKPEIGVMLVVEGRSTYEVTTFRSEGSYADGRRPDSVRFVDARSDVSRRDFTINGLLLDPITDEVLDWVGGLDDLEHGILRCIGDAEERFREDHLRLLRAVRFSVRLGFRLEQQTTEAARRLAHHAGTISGERLREELRRMLMEAPGGPALRKMADLRLWRAIVPGLALWLEDPSTLARLDRLCARPLPPAAPWLAVPGLPATSWWNNPHLGGGPSEPPPEGMNFLERLKTSRAECEAALLCWTRWPDLWRPFPRPPSTVASLLRERHVPGLLQLLERWVETQPDTPWPAHLAWRREESLGHGRPAPRMGRLLQDAGVHPGPDLGRAVRKADQIAMDLGTPPGPELARLATEAILPP